MTDGVHEMDDALLARDPAHEEDIRPRKVDPETADFLRGVSLAVFLRVDAVMDHMDPSLSTRKSRSTSRRASSETATTASAISMRSSRSSS